jgi:hypothetical protein
MKVYRIVPDLEKYQIILPVSDSDEIQDMLDFNGLVKKNVWTPIEFYVDNPLKLKGDFFSFINPSAFACNKSAVDKLMYYWDQSAELLPIYLEANTELFIVNVIECVNALDKKNSQHDVYSDGVKSNRIIRFAFHPNRLHEPSVFKIPETVDTQILTYSGVKNPENEFMYAYEQSGLKGLKFELIFNNDII